ncbi:hypothetical protein TrVE_jg10939 [Triparma verrucosa]|uniref:Uncharacterized protein n=1 Tax=Triparma verrucosa TaxID=1606542 RepID=A0A9W7ERB5_9STRA|nr:hypothetical protein TrVE_jg10939 [Triparma verrucosa]
MKISPGAEALMNAERAAADWAIRHNLYVLFRSSSSSSPNPDFCSRVGPTSRCFCGCPFSEHAIKGKGKSSKCRNCAGCRRFQFIFSRPEEVGDDYLPRRRGFNMNTWRAKCRCGHSHEEHCGPRGTTACTACGCGSFDSNFLCLVCDRHWEEHDTVFETGEERLDEGLPVGSDFIPLSEAPSLQSEIFGAGQKSASPEVLLESGAISVSAYHDMIKGMDGLAVASASNGSVGMRVKPSAVRVNPKQPKGKGKAERSVKLSHITSGGTKTGRVLNRWGKTEK